MLVVGLIKKDSNIILICPKPNYHFFWLCNTKLEKKNMFLTVERVKNLAIRNKLAPVWNTKIQSLCMTLIKLINCGSQMSSLLTCITLLQVGSLAKYSASIIPYRFLKWLISALSQIFILTIISWSLVGEMEFKVWGEYEDGSGILFIIRVRAKLWSNSPPMLSWFFLRKGIPILCSKYDVLLDGNQSLFSTLSDTITISVT